MVKIKKGDSVQLTFVGRIKEGNQIFDLNDKEVAKENNMDPEQCEPAIITVGEGDVVKGLDENLEGKETGRKYRIEIAPEKGFGKKDASLYKLVSASKFKTQGVKPYPGMQVNVEGKLGIVKTVSGGRIMVDLNHPLAGRDVVYEYKIDKVVDNDQTIIENFSKMYLGNAKVQIKEDTATIETDFPKELHKEVGKKILVRVKKVKKIEFVAKKPQKNK